MWILELLTHSNCCPGLRWLTGTHENSWASEKNLGILSALKLFPQTISQFSNTTEWQDEEQFRHIFNSKNSSWDLAATPTTINICPVFEFSEAERISPNKFILSERRVSLRQQVSPWHLPAGWDLIWTAEAQEGPLLVLGDHAFWLIPSSLSPFQKCFQWHQKPRKINSLKCHWFKKYDYI